LIHPFWIFWAVLSWFFHGFDAWYVIKIWCPLLQNGFGMISSESEVANDTRNVRTRSNCTTTNIARTKPTGDMLEDARKPIILIYCDKWHVRF
jgi:hypothetical protein